MTYNVIVLLSSNVVQTVDIYIDTWTITNTNNMAAVVLSTLVKYHLV